MKYDVAIYGAGYAGFAAARAAKAAGEKVVLIDSRCDLLWEASRSLLGSAPAADSKSLDDFKRTAAVITGISAEWIDPGSAEWIANELLIEDKIDCVYYALPSRRLDEESVEFSVREGTRTISAKRWLDATALDRAKPPTSRIWRVVFQRTRWDFAADLEIAPGVVFRQSPWGCEKILEIDERFATLLGAIRALREKLGAKYDDAFVSHYSFDPLPIYDDGYATVTDRWLAAENLPPLEIEVREARTFETDVCVLGLGTGGAIAAIAAGKEGARVVAVEPQSFPGGVMTAAGIHAYYYGVPGGYFEKIDDKVEAIMPLFASRKSWPRGYHPLAKRIVLEEELSAAKVNALYNTRFVGVTETVCEGERKRVAEISCRSASGEEIRIRAKAFIDATGEGFLCGACGVPWTFGRPDGKVNPCTQSWATFGWFREGLSEFITNFDTGQLDPRSSEAMTRERIAGIHALVMKTNVHSSNAFNRTCGVFPDLGIREGALYATDYRISLEDLVGGTTFEDCVGYVAGHIDTHLRDFENETPKVAEYLKAGRWGHPVGCEIPYRELLPVGVSNVWLACRAIGLGPGAQYCFRMQRDIQRIGEVAGIAAALAASADTDSRGVDYSALRARLVDSGAVGAIAEKRFGIAAEFSIKKSE